MGEKINLKLFYTVKDIPIENLLHSDQYAYENEGYGGKPVYEWPIYRFFNLYHSGKINEAQQLFEHWYLEQYQKYSALSKSKGGMKNGSLDKLYENINNEINIDHLLKEAIETRVNQRLLLLDKIQKSGYRSNKLDPVKALGRTNDKYILFGGHHRVAILYTLGYRYVPNVYAFKNRFKYMIFKSYNKLILF